MAVNRKNFPKVSDETIIRFQTKDPLNRPEVNIQAVVTPNGYKVKGWGRDVETIDKQIRLSMNGTACLSIEELDILVDQIRSSLEYRGATRTLEVE